ACPTMQRSRPKMFDYSQQIEAFREKKVRLSSDFKEKLLAHRAANRKRLVSRLPNHLEQVHIGEANFKPQGSVAMGTIIQTRFANEEYDIDDGLVLSRAKLDANGEEKSAEQVRVAIRDALKDRRFKKQPDIHHNCVRVYYADEDEEKHHVDFPVYRLSNTVDDEPIRELASASGWIESDPTQVNVWFEGVVKGRNSVVTG